MFTQGIIDKPSLLHCQYITGPVHKRSHQDIPTYIVPLGHVKPLYLRYLDVPYLPKVDTIATMATTRLPVWASVVIVLPMIGPSSRFVLLSISPPCLLMMMMLHLIGAQTINLA